MTLSTGGIDVCACRRHTSVSKANEGKRKDWRYGMPTVEVAPRGPRPPIRLRPAPRCDPPFDDELEPHVWAAGTHQLALEWPAHPVPRPVPPPPRPETAAALRGDAPAPADPGPRVPAGGARLWHTRALR